MDVSMADIPLPNLTDYNIQLLDSDDCTISDRKFTALGDSEDNVYLPNTCVHTIINSSDQAICADVSLNGDIVVCGFADSSVKAYIRTGDVEEGSSDEESEGDENDNESKPDPDSEEERKIELEKLVKKEKNLKIKNLKSDEIDFVGHTGAVYSVSISYDGQLLISSSHDTTIRLWSIPTKPVYDKQTALVVYKGHVRPVWCVKFSPLGYYFASGSADKTAKLWVTREILPIRIFKGHFTDVEAVEFHPNLHYVATAGNDQTIRLWAVDDASCVRILITNNSPTRCLKFTNSGKHIFSTNDKGDMIIHDIDNCNVVKIQKQQSGNDLNAIWAMDISQDDKVVAVGTEDSYIIYYSLKKLINTDEDNLDALSDSQQFIKKIPLKSTQLFSMKFSLRNLLSTVGRLEDETI